MTSLLIRNRKEYCAAAAAVLQINKTSSLLSRGWPDFDAIWQVDIQNNMPITMINEKNLTV